MPLNEKLKRLAPGGARSAKPACGTRPSGAFHLLDSAQLLTTTGIVQGSYRLARIAFRQFGEGFQWEGRRCQSAAARLRLLRSNGGLAGRPAT